MRDEAGGGGGGGTCKGAGEVMGRAIGVEASGGAELAGKGGMGALGSVGAA